MTPEQVLDIISFIPYFFLIPICIYGNVNLYSYHRSDLFVKKRSTFLLFGLNISCFTLIIFNLQAQYCRIYQIGTQALNTIPGVLSWSLILFFLISKNWLIYWRYKWQYYTLQTKWQKVINPVVADKKWSNFYLRNNNIYGKLSFVTKVFGIWILIEAILNTLTFLLRDLGYISISRPIGIFASSIVILTIILYAIIVCKTPYYNDIYFIHWESKIHSKLMVSCGIASFLFVIIVIASGRSSRFASHIIYPIVSITFTVMSYISTFVIIKKNTIGNDDDKAENIMVDIITSQTQSSSDKIEIGVERVLSDKKAINLFMNHLSKELSFFFFCHIHLSVFIMCIHIMLHKSNRFSMECLLSVIEISQFQDYLMSNDGNFKIGADARHKVRGSKITFPSNVPLSEFLCDAKKNNNDIKIIIHEIYRKYISNGSEFEINIPSTIRSRFNEINQKSDIDWNDLMLLLEKCKQEMKILLMYSLTRFKATPQFDEVKQIFNNQEIV